MSFFQSMTARRCLAGLAVATIATTTACSGSSGGGESSDEEVFIGIAAAKTGIFSAYDFEAAQALQLRIDQINDDGGIDGKKVRSKFIDTKSDRALASTAATQLIGEGANVIVTTCDFDFGSPAAIVAQRKGIASFSLCAEDPKFADTNTIGDLAFSIGPGTDVGGSLAAEWASKNGWKSAYFLNDESIEYSKSLSLYFGKRWSELGGKSVGSDKFIAGEGVKVNAQVTRMKGSVDDADFIVVPSWLPGVATVVRQIRDAGIDKPIVVPGAAGEGKLLTDIAGDVSDVYVFPFACTAVCTGEDNPQLTEFQKAYEDKWGKPTSSTYALLGYDLMTTIAAGVEKAGSTDGKKLAASLEGIAPIKGLSGDITFTDKCHKPGQSEAVVKVDGGKESFVERFKVESVPEVAGNPCSGTGN